MSFRPYESSKNIVDFYRRYLLTTFKTNNEIYDNQLKEILKKEKIIFDGPYINISDPFEKGHSLKELAKQEKVSKKILEIKKFYPDRKLYKHQEEALLEANKKENLIITTGTGSGKTESFLIPVINQLLKEKEAGTLDKGVRTIIIYPMNALVNDQIRRLRELLSETDITFGRFTGETKETYRDAKKEYIAIEGKNPTENEIISREQIRETPPNILITNYAMLEYMLLRPDDSPIFELKNSHKWKYIVLDEAHTYTGTKGIEVSSLIKRLKTMIKRKDIKFILTSATLGNKDSNREIINFGENLCSTEFKESSIIRSSTSLPNTENEIKELDFKIYRILSEKIRENNLNSEELVNIIKKYDENVLENENIEEMLFDMVLHDKFYYKIREILSNETKTVLEIAKKLKIEENDLTDFITVASKALKNGEKLFEAKYHMFLKGIEGIYITLKPSNKLFINKMETYKENKDDKLDIGYKAYEITFCNNCNALYIIGEEEDGYLVQKSKWNKSSPSNVYLLNTELIDSDYDLEENRYELCSKCGKIKRESSVEKLNCGHGDENINKIIKIKENQLNKCPCCHSFNAKRSILRSYYLGSEAATAVISTALYNELPAKEYKIEKIKRDEDDFFGNNTFEKEEKQEIEIDKQFLAFSDSRQAAAFFATYLQETYLNNLIKRLIYIISQEEKEKLERGISLDRIVELLVIELEKHKIHRKVSYEKIETNAWIYILKEFSNYKAKNSLLRTGTLMFDIDYKNENGIDKLGLSADEVTNLIKILCQSMMKDASIEKLKEFSEENIKKISITNKKNIYTKEKNVKNEMIEWCPEEGKTNKRLKYITKILGDNSDNIKFLRKIWDELEDKEILVKLENGKVLNSKKIKVRSIDKLYMCKECKNVTPYNIRNICDNPMCKGELEEYDYKSNLDDHHYSYLMKNLYPSPMEVREHTAQLSNEHAYEYQKEFKEKKINVLSCSTTFEMGVDVGSLETVFMRNMPPSPANYVQRAGRAGRSLQSAAYALTFCPNTSHDLNYFKQPVTMIKGSIKPPYFDIDNPKIQLRHIFATAFSHFWRKNREYYKEKIDEFVKMNGFEKIAQYLETHPEELLNDLKNIVPETLKEEFDIENFGWINKLFDEKEGICQIILSKYKESIENLIKEENELKEKRNYKDAEKIKKSIETIKNQKIIEFLSRNNLIPKYGFPVDTVELEDNNENLNLRLSRDLLSAISEYAPGSEIVADGKLITSRYIRPLAGYTWPTYHYIKCPECLTLNKSLTEKEIKTCKQCGTNFYSEDMKKYIIPKFGFIKDKEKPKPVGLNKPERTYKGTISYTGDDEKIKFTDYIVCDKRISLGNSKMNELTVLNESQFYICETCGYGIVEDSKFKKVIEKKHKNTNGYNCSNTQLVSYSLGHEFLTDVTLIRFKDISIENKDKAWTILYSMLEGLSRYITVDRTEISGCLQWYRDKEHSRGNYGFVLFDNTPGGAGFVRQLENEKVLIGMLKEAFKVVSTCSCGGVEANTACYSCLCNYYNQKQHDILKRKYAIEFYKEFSDNWNENLECSKMIENELTNKNFIKNFELKILGKGKRITVPEEVWENLLDICEEEEKSFIEKIKNRNINNIEEPIFSENIKILGTNEEIEVNLIWEKKRVMLFLSDYYDEYEKAKKTDWKCYFIKDKFEIDEFLERIKK